jgi:hypothetical protein
VVGGRGTSVGDVMGILVVGGGGRRSRDRFGITSEFTHLNFRSVLVMYNTSNTVYKSVLCGSFSI